MSEMSPEELVKGFIKFFQEELTVLNQDLDRLGVEPESREKMTVAMLSAALNLARVANYRERLPKWNNETPRSVFGNDWPGGLTGFRCPALLTPEEREAFVEARK